MKFVFVWGVIIVFDNRQGLCVVDSEFQRFKMFDVRIICMMKTGDNLFQFQRRDVPEYDLCSSSNIWVVLFYFFAIK